MTMTVRCRNSGAGPLLLVAAELPITFTEDENLRYQKMAVLYTWGTIHELPLEHQLR
jgi:hypothetical protein